jgi:PAS domain S-box-containing protein
LLPEAQAGKRHATNQIPPPGDRFLANLLEDTMDAIVGLSPEQHVTLWNRGAEALFGWKAEEILGQPVSVLVPEGHQSELPELQRRVEREGHVSDFPAVRRRRDGKELRVRLTRTALHDKQGRLIGTSVIVRDETAHLEATRQMQHSEKMAAVGQLAAGVAHELGTPLNVIAGTAEALESDLGEGEEARVYLRTIREQAEACARLLRDMMNYARQPAFEMRAIDLNDCVEDTLRLAQRLFERDQITIATDLAADLPRTEADANQLQQVLMNVFINAWQAMGSDGELRVETEADPDRDAVMVRINDTGPGIKPTDLPHVFNPFFTTKRGGLGTGLGLAVCDQIITGHGGSITASSRPGRGATFTIRLPERQRRDVEAQAR